MRARSPASQVQSTRRERTREPLMSPTLLLSLYAWAAISQQAWWIFSRPVRVFKESGKRQARGWSMAVPVSLRTPLLPTSRLAREGCLKLVPEKRAIISVLDRTERRKFCGQMNWPLMLRHGLGHHASLTQQHDIKPSSFSRQLLDFPWSIGMRKSVRSCEDNI